MKQPIKQRTEQRTEPPSKAPNKPPGAAIRVYDPYPIPDHQGLTATHELDWPRIATTLVRQNLQLQPAERVIISADPYFGGAALDAIRCEIQRVRGIELASILHWTPSVAKLRNAQGRSPDPLIDQAETQAMRELFACADVFILLMNDRRGGRTVATSQSDQVVNDWPRGRAVHLHWFHDPAHPDPAHPVNLAHDRVNQAALVDLDYAWIKTMMLKRVELMRGREIRITDTAGTDLRFLAGQHFHTNYGDASRERIASMKSGRDREEELPVGSFRFIPQAGSAEGCVVFPKRRNGESPALGRGFDTGPFVDAGLRFEFRGGRVVGMQTGGDQQRLRELWDAETGDKDVLGELVLGCNPLLRPVAGSGFLPHYGFGAGVVRVILGDNVLSGGNFRSSFHRWLMWNDASVTVEGRALIEGGQQLE
jgi:leucyl aminopeptidase (aminopeptidase T)